MWLLPFCTVGRSREYQDVAHRRDAADKRLRAARGKVFRNPDTEARVKPADVWNAAFQVAANYVPKDPRDRDCVAASFEPPHEKTLCRRSQQVNDRCRIQRRRRLPVGDASMASASVS
jgi:hypothetical protein